MATKAKFNIDQCLKLKLLVKVPGSKSKAEKSIEAGISWLQEADKNLRSKAYKSSILSSYLAMFHAARSFLIFDGYREKSHFAVARFLEDKYVRSKQLEKQWVELLDFHREMRHTNQYSITAFASKNEATEAYHSARDFVNRMKRLLADIEPE